MNSLVCSGRPQPIELSGALPIPPVGHYFDTARDGSVLCRFCGHRPLR